MSRYRKEITFYYSNPVECQTATPLAAEAERRGYRIELTEEPFRKSEIGVYCAHDCFPRQSRLALVMLHDMGQGQLNWPNMWRFEPWNDFDAGILPGDTWAERWRGSSWHPFTRPRQGVFQLGWPKSDAIFSGDDDTLSAEARTLKQGLDLQHDISILYAPAWENDNKQDEFVRALIDMPVNLLLKQYPWTDEWPDMMANVAAANALHRDIAPNVHILDPAISIMHAIELGDVMVSEESSCLIEALLKGRPAISVGDWMVPDTQPPRLPAAPFDFLIRTNKGELAVVVADIVADLAAHKEAARRQRDRNFCNLGHSAASIMDLIDAMVEQRDPPFDALEPRHTLRPAPAGDQYRKYLRKTVYTLKHHLGIKQPIKKLVYEMLRRS
jgi:hypothetical protein